jgi:hypothetical protein
MRAKLALHRHQRIPKPDMVFLGKAVLAHIFVIAFGSVVWRIAIEKAHRTVILRMSFSKSLFSTTTFAKRRWLAQ